MTVGLVRRNYYWATGITVLIWVVLALGRAWQVGASLSHVAPYVYAPVMIVLGVWLGSWAARRVDPRVTGGVVVMVAGYIAVAALSTTHPGRGAIGYANANAALAVQLMALAAIVSLHRVARRLGLAGCAVAAVAVLSNASQGGIATGVLVVLALTVSLVRSPRRRWPAVVLSLGISGAAVGVLMSLARRTMWPEQVVAALTTVRKDMWNAAWAAFRRAETFGYGPGGYAQVNPWAADADTVAAHSLPLQVAAELGGVGLVLLTVLFLCGLTWAASARSPGAAWIAIAAWTAVATHAFMDHLLEYWPIALAAGLVLGYGLVAQADTEPEDKVV